MKTGIMLNLCGDDKPLTQNIYNNDITNCSSAGIHLLESRSYISENYVGHCGEGVRLESRSYTAIYGNPNASDYSEMNRIFNEDSYEFYISKNSFPWYFHYNAIIDNDNGGNSVDDPLIYYDNANDLNHQSQKDVRYNCWGSGFSASSDLFPAIDFDYLPTYCPPLPPSQSSPVETLYQNSLDQFTAEDYADSKAGFMFIVDQYPETKYAQSAMCELVPLEKYADNDYLALQNYFLTNTTIQSDTILAPLASKLANECDIELENYSTAVNYFEGVIQDPADTQDSIYAIIDLGYLYETMGAGNKASFAGKMPQYKPKSIKQFNKYKYELLSMLPVKKETQTGISDIGVVAEEVFAIHPNPFRDVTTFGYKLKAEGIVQFIIYASDGNQVQVLSEGTQTSGIHEVTYNSSSLDAGIYYCSLEVDGVVVETRKMVVVR